MANAIGPDISFYQDDDDTPEGIDFSKMRGISDFVIIRVGQNQWIDPDFKTNWVAAKEAGLPRGSYWYYDSRIEPQRQAEMWRDALGEDQGELPLFADFEEDYGGEFKGWRKWYAFLEYLKEAMPGKEIVVYTAYYYWKDNGPDPQSHASSLEYFHQYPLWIANYSVSKPSVPAPWSEDEWLFWQYTETGDGPAHGVETLGIDLNYFNGDSAAFRERFNIPDAPPPSGNITYKVDLSLREGPDTNQNVLGTLEHDEILKKVGSSSDGDWLKLERKDGQSGWSLKQYLIQQEAPDPDPDPDPDPVPVPVEQWGRVLPTALNIREGASSLHAILGTLAQDQIVKVLEYSDDKSWVKILDETGGLSGWGDSRYFVFLDSPPSTDPDLDPEPDPDIDKWFRVTPIALNVRQGPGTNFEVLGTVKRNEVVEKIEMNPDEKWFKIRNIEGLVGWVYASYLVETVAPEGPFPNPTPDPEPTPNPDPDPEPVPGNEFLGRYQVTTLSLNVREGPGLSEPVVGKVSQNDIVQIVDVNEDGSWRKIVKDDLTGWCSAKYLAHYPQPIAMNKKYFNKSVRYIREIYQTPRKMIAHVLVIDTRYEKMDFLVTPPDHNSDAAPVCGRTTSEFLTRHGLQIAINGDGYRYVNPSEAPALSCPEDRDLLNPNSYAASRGKVYSQRWTNEHPILYISKQNAIAFNERKGGLYNAVSGDRMLVEKGKPVAGLDNTTLEPRSAIGMSSNGRWMILIVIDGRQPGYSEGCTFLELANMLIKFGGVYTAMNLDGGGSSAMVIENNGVADLLNSPIEGGIPGKERRVANHLGIEIR